MTGFGCKYAGFTKWFAIGWGSILLSAALSRTVAAQKPDPFADEVAKVRAAGEPVNLPELAADFKKNVRGEDILAATAAALAKDTNGDLRKNLPFVGPGKDPPPPPGKPWEELETAEMYLATRAAAFEFLESLNKRTNPHFSIDYADPDAFRQPAHEDLVRNGARLLQLKFFADWHRGRTAEAVHDTVLLFNLAAAMNEDRTTTLKLVQRALRAIGVRQIEKLLTHDRLTAELMRELQMPLRQIDTAEDVRKALLGERANGNTLMTFTLDPVKLNFTVAPTKETVAANASNAPPRLEDAAFQLEQYRLLLTDLDAPLVKFVVAADQVKQNLGEFAYPPADTPQKLTNLFLHPNISSVYVVVRGHALYHAADVALAAEQHRLVSKRWPAAAGELVPKYLPGVPFDPFDGKPLRWFRTESELRIYTISNKKIDNRGVFDLVSMNDGVTVPLR